MGNNKYNHDMRTGRKLARDEVAAAMSQDGCTAEEVREALGYPTIVSTKEAISRGKRYEHHLEMARIRKRNGGSSREQPVQRVKWNVRSEIVLRCYYLNPEVSLEEIADMCGQAIGEPVSASACIGKAYRMELGKRPARKHPCCPAKKEVRDDQSSSQKQGSRRA